VKLARKTGYFADDPILPRGATTVPKERNSALSFQKTEERASQLRKSVKTAEGNT
jgi:hypothetical protein